MILFKRLLPLLILCQILTAQTITHDYRTGEILLQTIDNQSIEKIVKDLNIYSSFDKTDSPFTIKTIASDLNVYKIMFDNRLFDMQEVLSKVNRHTRVKAAQFNYWVDIRSTPNDPLYINQWSLRKINAPSVWDATTGGLTACGDTIVIAVLDKGFDINHTDLASNIWKNRFEIPNNNKDDDGNGYIDDYQGLNLTTGNDKHFVESHGTWCSGVIGASGNNSRGITGINWQVKMMILSGITDSEKILEAYNYALQLRKLYKSSNGAKGAFVTVTSMSLGFSGKYPSDFPILCNIYNTLGQDGILNVVAADNVDSDISVSGDIPGLCPSEHLIVVTRTNESDLMPRSAGYNTTHVDLAAPGESVMTTYLDNRFDVISGNSFAAPLVAGAAALLYSIPQDSICKLSKTNPLTALNLVKDAILKEVDTVASLKTRTATGGRLNIAKSFTRLSKLKRIEIGNPNITKIFPNPVDKALYLNVILPENPSSLSIIVSNTLGEIVIQRKITEKDLFSDKITINTEGLAAGLYSVSILADSFKTAKKFVVVH